MKIKKNDFTLPELVVVVASFSLLLALAHGATRITQAKSAEAQCVGNLKKLYQIFITYANDYDDSLPVKINKSGGKSPWLYVLADAYPEKFTGKLWSKLAGRHFWNCPSCPLNDWKDSCSGGASDYGLNGLAFSAPEKKATFKMKEAAPSPKHKFLLADVPLTKYRPYLYPVSYLSLSNRHNLRGNYIFFDGHGIAYAKKVVYRWKEKDWSAFARDSNQRPWNCDIEKENIGETK